MEASPGEVVVEDSKVEEAEDKMEVGVEANKSKDEVESKDGFEGEMDSSEALRADSRMQTRKTRRTRRTRRQC
jgi:hypothetical protein